MKTTSIFNHVIGPVMRGPSSSHTAGAFHIGAMACSLLGAAPSTAAITFDPAGSYARCYREQGADLAFAAGLMGWPITDERFPKALEAAAESGLTAEFAVREDVPWPTVAAILAIARFCEPSSELHIEDTWYRRTALDDLVGVAPEQVHTDRLYAGLDALLVHKEAIEQHLKARLGDLFDLKYDLLLYDVTSTYFEGQCLGNPMAKRGYSRDRPTRRCCGSGTFN